MPNGDPNEIVRAKFVPADEVSDFSFSSAIEQDADVPARIKYGDVVNLRREEAEQRADFVIVGEEATTAGVVLQAAPTAPPASAADVPEASVVAPPPARSPSTGPESSAPFGASSEFTARERE